VFITIITDGYMSIKYRSNYDWLEKRMTPILPSISETPGGDNIPRDLGMINNQNNEDLKLIEDDDLK